MILDLQSQLRDRIEHRQVAPVQKEYHLVGSMIIKPNQQLYALDLDTLEVFPVEITKTVAELKADGTVNARNRASHNPNCLYYPAYTISQASKHFIKVLNKAFPDE
jgi:hypothetical protein